MYVHVYTRWIHICMYHIPACVYGELTVVWTILHQFFCWQLQVMTFLPSKVYGSVLYAGSICTLNHKHGTHLYLEMTLK